MYSKEKKTGIAWKKEEKNYWKAKKSITLLTKDEESIWLISYENLILSKCYKRIRRDDKKV